MELFETKGYPATTIDDIAMDAGVSRTTFFRYCATKEAAVLVDDAGLETELVAIAGTAPAGAALAHLETAWAEMTRIFDSDPEGYGRFLRVRRLMRDNPPLLAAGLERDARLTEQIAEALRAQAGLADLDAHAVAESFATGTRLAFDEWVRRADAGDSSALQLSEVYRRVRAALRRATGGAGR